jgi:hypothetical protein
MNFPGNNMFKSPQQMMQDQVKNQLANQLGNQLNPANLMNGNNGGMPNLGGMNPFGNQGNPNGNN